MGTFAIEVKLASGETIKESEYEAKQAYETAMEFVRRGAKTVEVTYKELLFYHQILTPLDNIRKSDVHKFYDCATTDPKDDEDQYAENQVE